MIRMRDIGGWLLVLLGLGMFALTFYVLITRRWIVEAAPMVMMGFIVFRGGIHLLKVAIAAKVCQPVAEVVPKPRRRA